ncbi:MAG: ABC transporter substrate-binding protein [Nocardioidaceae bacterium]|nr:ABC transporter substrate-binding protein [Nocardioidaceae bacterium]
MNRRFRTTSAIIAVTVLLAACGSDDGSSDDPAADTDAAAQGTTASGATPATASASPGGGDDSCASVDLSTPPDEPVTMRIGHGTAAEENYWYQFVDPEGAGAQHYGSWYTIEASPFNPTDRLDAYQAGSLDGGTLSTPQFVTAIAAGLPITAVGSIALESSDEQAFNTTYSALESSGITSPADLEGKTIGILAPNTATEWWAKSAVASAGLDPERDAQYVAIPFPEQEAALRDGTIDVGVFVEPFYGISRAEGGLVDVFDSLTGPGVDHELLLAWFDTAFIEEHTEAFCAWRADYVAATESYLADREAAATALIDADVLLAESVAGYMQTTDYARRPSGAINLGGLDVVITDMVDVGFLPEDQTAPAAELVTEGYSIIEK